jgi:threonine/homoserine/homoserine lactone efflux protein
MVTLSQLLLTAGAAIIFALVPGPAVIYVITRSIDQSPRAGILSALGVATGNLALVVAAAVGLSALLASSPLAYTIVRYVGAAYLVYLGIRKFLDRSKLADIESTRAQPLTRLYQEGLVVGVLNPKAALFFLAFLPQFVDRDHGAIALQIILLGCLVVALTFASDSCYAALAGGIAQRVLRKPRLIRGQQVVAACVYIGLGLFAAFAGADSTSG